MELSFDEHVLIMGQQQPQQPHRSPAREEEEVKKVEGDERTEEATRRDSEEPRAPLPGGCSPGRQTEPHPAPPCSPRGPLPLLLLCWSNALQGPHVVSPCPSSERAEALQKSASSSPGHVHGITAFTTPAVDLTTKQYRFYRTPVGGMIG
ncbi:unnamed protein product [Lampetra planeri]